MITVFGSLNLDLIFNLPHIPPAGETVLGPATRIEPGGKGANQAVAAARDGGQVAMAGAIGRDALAEGALVLLRQAGVDLSRIATVDASTGCAAIMVDPAGANAIAVGSGANRLARADQVEDALLTGTVVLQMEVPATEVMAIIRRTRQARGRIILNLAPAAPLPEPVLRQVDVLVVNEAEGTWLADHLECIPTATGLSERLAGVAVVLTRGEAGADVATQAAGWHQPALRVEAVDTTAAGDCFAGVLAHRLDCGASLADAVRAASIAAALCCTRPGSQGSIPLRSETDRAAGPA